MKSIIIATDFSPVSLNAVDFGAAMALAIDADIYLVHVYNIPLAYTDVPLSLVNPEELKFSAEQQLETVRQRVISTTDGKRTVVAEARMGNTVDELASLCETQKPFAVVLGARGKTGLEKIIFGSTALAAIRHLDAPVICVPPGYQYGKGIRKIALACDFREVGSTIPESAIRSVVNAFGAELHILNVDYLQKNLRADTPMESSVLYNMFRDIDPGFHYIDYPDIEEGITGFAQSKQIDLVIAIPKKHKLLQSIFKPSSTRQLIFQSQIPVMCVHA